MKSFYDALTGKILPVRYEGSTRHLAANTPPGAIAIEGALDPHTQRIDILTGDVVARNQDPPDSAELWRVVRIERDRLLRETDWITIRATDRGGPVPLAWLAYRQALRDITLQPDPLAIEWPQPPEV